MQFTRPPEIASPIMLPLFSERVPCGFPGPAQEYVEDRLDLNTLLIKHSSATYFIKVSGESMHDAVSDEFTVKKLRTRPVVQLVPHNHDDDPISSQHVDEPELFGVVVFSIKAHK
jgi:DNA polymerase V